MPTKVRALAVIEEPECWSVSILDENGNPGRWCVNEEDFEQIEVGQDWVAPKDAAPARRMEIRRY